MRPKALRLSAGILSFALTVAVGYRVVSADSVDSNSAGIESWSLVEYTDSEDRVDYCDEGNQPRSYVRDFSYILVDDLETFYANYPMAREGAEIEDITILERAELESLSEEEQAAIEAEGIFDWSKHNNPKYAVVLDLDDLSAEDRAYLEAEGLTILEESELWALPDEERWAITDEGFTYWNTGIGPNDEAFSIYAAVENSEALTAEDRAFIEAEGLTIVEKSELEALSADLRYVAVENSEALTAEDRAFIEAEGLTIVEKPELEALSPEEQWNIQGEGLVYWNWVRPHYEYVVVSHLEELSAANRVSIEAEGLTILEESELEALSPEERAAIEAKGITGVWSPPSTYLVVEDLDWADEEGRRSLERHGYVIFERAELAALPEEERAAIEAEGLTPLERLMCVRPQGASKN